MNFHSVSICKKEVFYNNFLRFYTVMLSNIVSNRYAPFRFYKWPGILYELNYNPGIIWIFKLKKMIPEVI